jgi:hypothetical protein
MASRNHLVGWALDACSNRARRSASRESFGFAGAFSGLPMRENHHDEKQERPLLSIIPSSIASKLLSNFLDAISGESR